MTIFNGPVVDSFLASGGSFTPLLGTLDTLSLSGSLYTLTDSSGDQFVFHDDGDSTIPAAERGALDSMTDPGGDSVQIHFNSSDGSVSYVIVSSPGSSTEDKYAFSYYTSGDNTGLVYNIALYRSSDGGSTWPSTPIQKAVYTYWDNGDAFGSAGEMKLAEIQDGSGAALDDALYCWYSSTSTATGHYTGALEYYFNNASYHRLLAAHSGSESTALADTSSLAGFATEFAQYDTSERVTQLVVQGAGTYAYGYYATTTATGFNSWAYETVETLPDGTTNTVYSNGYAETLVVDHSDGTHDWDTAYVYDSSTGRLVETDNPSAVSSYTATPGTGAFSISLNSTGLIE